MSSDQTAHKSSPLPKSAAESQGEGVACAPTNKDQGGSYGWLTLGRSWRQRMALVAALILLGVGLYFAIPWLANYFNRVSTDDAYVSGYVTYIGPRIASRVEQVAGKRGRLHTRRRGAGAARSAAFPLWRSNRLRPSCNCPGKPRTNAGGDPLAALPPSGPEAVPGPIGRSTNCRYKIARCKSAVAELKLDQAQLVLAERNFARNTRLLPAGASRRRIMTKGFRDLEGRPRQSGLASEKVQRIRAELGLPRNTENPTQVPARHRATQPADSGGPVQLGHVADPDRRAAECRRLQRRGFEHTARQVDGRPNLVQGRSNAVIDDAPAVQVALANVSQAEAALDTGKTGPQLHRNQSALRRVRHQATP